MGDLTQIAAQMTKDAKRLEHLEAAMKWIDAYGATQRAPKDDLEIRVVLNRASACAGASNAADAYADAIMIHWPEVHDFAVGLITAEIQRIKERYAGVLE